MSPVVWTKQGSVRESSSSLFGSHRRGCPPDADDATMTMYARAWVCHLFATMLFPGNTGDAASWMYIPTLAHWHEVGSYSWGSAVLAYL
jgi:hypothetical protein